MAWERVEFPKEFGGMGFRNFKAFNLAMVADSDFHKCLQITRADQ